MTGRTEALWKRDVDERSLVRIRLQAVHPNPYQPRRAFSEASIAELAASIRQYGLLSPVIVRRVGADEYELIAGERRLRALRLLGETHTEAIVTTAADRDSALMALIENLQREDLNYFEEAEAYLSLIRDHGFSQEEISRRIGRSPSSVANRLRLLRLPGDLRARLTAAKLSERHARSLLRLSDERMQRYALDRAVADKLSVKQLESLVEQLRRDGVCVVEEPERRRVRGVFRDHRVFVNALLDTIRTIQQAGVGASSRIVERETCVEITVVVPREHARRGADDH